VKASRLEIIRITHLCLLQKAAQSGDECGYRDLKKVTEHSMTDIDKTREQQLAETIEQLDESLSNAEKLKQIFAAAVSSVEAERGFVVRHNAESGKYDEFCANHNIEADEVNATHWMQRALEDVVDSKKSLLKSNVEYDESAVLPETKAVLPKLYMILLLPLLKDEDGVGILYLDVTVKNRTFIPKDLELVKLAASHIQDLL
jgi:hypothetical protein